MGGLGEALIPAYRRDVTAARERLAHPPVPVRRVALPTGDLEYARVGEGRPLLVLHGAPQGWDGGIDWASRVADSGYDVLAVSRFGYLWSALPDGATTATQADAYAGLLDALGIERVDVAGISAGSMTAIRFAGQHPDRVRRLVLESPMLPTRKPVRLPPAGFYRVAARVEPLLWAIPRLPGMTKLAAGVRYRDLDDDARAELAEIMGTALPMRPRVAGAVFDRAVATPELYRGELPVDAITAPTLVVNNADALLAPHDDATAFVARLPDARLVELTAGGHVNIGQTARIREELATFLA